MPRAILLRSKVLADVKIEQVKLGYVYQAFSGIDDELRVWFIN